jgi:hypothetical protein
MLKYLYENRYNRFSKLVKPYDYIIISQKEGVYEKEE